MSERRRIIGEKIIDLGNYTIVALIFGQFAVEKKDFRIIIVGGILAMFCWIVGFIILKKERRMK